uniref:Rab9 effector protein with kelch motifs n=1 Tax=Xiphophorus maculatus TaxID=8083 RepID=A0A3B5RAT9_XIPMA
MALASGHWLEKEIRGEPPSPHGHAVAVAGSVAFLFGGASSISPEVSPVYFSDFYMLTVTWEEIPQSGEIPSAREGHTLVVRGKLYLFGGSSSPEASECLPGVYSFDVSLAWECLSAGGVAPRVLRSGSAAAGDNIYMYGGRLEGEPTDDLLVFNTWGQSFTQAGDQLFMFGGYGAGGTFCKDLYALNTKLQWQKWEVKGESPPVCSGQTLTAHHDKDIYLFGGQICSKESTATSSNEIHKLSIKMKWKVPLYVGIPPARRHGHAAFILHSHLYVFGGKNEEQDLNDLKVMKLINPSERQPMKEILSEFGLQGVSHFTPTKVPNVRYELLLQVCVHRDFSAVRDQAMKMIQAAFTLLDQEFQKLDELKEMLEKHRNQNEAWLRARAEENDRERRELSRLRQEEVLQDQERLKEEQSSVQKRSEHLLSIMQQFKGM